MMVLTINREPAASQVYQTSPVILHVLPDLDPGNKAFRLPGKKVPSIKVSQILAWIKSIKPEWDTERKDLTIFLASQSFIDDHLKEVYDRNIKNGTPVPDHFNIPGSVNAFFTQSAVEGTITKYYIYLPWNFRLENAKDEATLVHELWHYVQRINNIPEECEDEHEFQAYFYSAAYLMENRGMKSTSPAVKWNIKKSSEHVCDSS